MLSAQEWVGVAEGLAVVGTLVYTVNRDRRQEKKVQRIADSRTLERIRMFEEYFTNDDKAITRLQTTLDEHLLKCANENGRLSTEVAGMKDAVDGLRRDMTSLQRQMAFAVAGAANRFREVLTPEGERDGT